MLVAVPSASPGGLDAPISAHFGHCDAFTLVRLTDGTVQDVAVVENTGHASGGCMTPVMELKAQGADALIAGGMGVRPLAGFQHVGIAVYFHEGSVTVGEAVERLARGALRVFGPAQTCGGGSGACGGHDHP